MIVSVFLILAGVVYAGAVLFLFYAVATAPMGYQDEA